MEKLRERDDFDALQARVAQSYNEERNKQIQAKQAYMLGLKGKKGNYGSVNRNYDRSLSRLSFNQNNKTRSGEVRNGTSHHGFASKEFASFGHAVRSSNPFQVSTEGTANRMHDTRQHLLAKGYWLDDYGRISALDPFKDADRDFRAMDRQIRRERSRLEAEYERDRMFSLLENQMLHQQRLDRKRLKMQMKSQKKKRKRRPFSFGSKKRRK